VVVVVRVVVPAAVQRDAREEEEGERRCVSLQKLRPLQADVHREILGATCAERTDGAMLGRGAFMTGGADGRIIGVGADGRTIGADGTMGAGREYGTDGGL
jgi:hypothetical protein